MKCKIITFVIYNFCFVLRIQIIIQYMWCEWHVVTQTFAFFSMIASCAISETATKRFYAKNPLKKYMGSWSYDLKVLSNCVHKKPHLKLKLRTQPANSPFELRTVMSPWKPFFLAEKCHRLRVNKIQLKCAEGGDMQDPI